jgi:hypothetical protein
MGNFATPTVAVIACSLGDDARNDLARASERLGRGSIRRAACSATWESRIL